MTAIGSREKQRTRAIAREYRSKGYEVIEDPTQEQLPDFLSGYHPDLLARKGDEARVVVVKSRASLAQEPQIRDLARLFHTKPNTYYNKSRRTSWRLGMKPILQLTDALQKPEEKFAKPDTTSLASLEIFVYGH